MGGSGTPIIVEPQCGKWNDGAMAAGTFRANQIGEVRKWSAAERGGISTVRVWTRVEVSHAQLQVPRASMTRRFPPNPKCASGGVREHAV